MIVEKSWLEGSKPFKNQNSAAVKLPRKTVKNVVDLVRAYRECSVWSWWEQTNSKNKRCCRIFKPELVYTQELGTCRELH